jgi:hypothetical protein
MQNSNQEKEILMATGNIKKSVTSNSSAGSSCFAADDLPIESGQPGRRYVIRDASAMSLDPQVGDFPQADVLFEGKTILAVGPHLQAGDAEVIDASGRIVMPGFIETHHHGSRRGCAAFLPMGS